MQIQKKDSFPTEYDAYAKGLGDYWHEEVIQKSLEYNILNTLAKNMLSNKQTERSGSARHVTV